MVDNVYQTDEYHILKIVKIIILLDVTRKKS